MAARKDAAALSSLFRCTVFVFLVWMFLCACECMCEIKHIYTSAMLRNVGFVCHVDISTDYQQSHNIARPRGSPWIVVGAERERDVAICDPLHYPTRVTVRRIKISVYVGRLFSLVYNGIILKDDLTQPGRSNSCYGQRVVYVDSIIGTFDIVVLFFFPVTVIICLYMRVFLTAVSQARAMRSHVAATTLHHSGTVLTKKSELKAARTLGIVVAWFLICFCTCFWLFFVQEIPDSAVILALFMLCVNPCLNPVIYALFYPWFRKSVRLIMSLQILQPGSSETNML